MTKPSTSYNDSHALIIGVDEYKNASPLNYAVSDATAIADTLVSKFGFQTSKTILLTNGDASRDRIHEVFLDLALDKTEVNDRLFFFFAGHGHTIRASRGEIGYLVPHDGDPSSLSTLIRWDELTRNADLIQAKHILFIMDACYGGLAITRALQPGTMRFVKDMMLRPARQVITAGKADEIVADSGGPRADHSVFTGHLLDALDGAARTKDGLITANGVMAYVYQNVSRDNESVQTPHFGYIAGDGDFLFDVPENLESDSDSKTDDDILVTVPAVTINDTEMTIIDQAKEYIADENQRIRLHDIVSQETRAVLADSSEDNFPVGNSWTPEEFAQRVMKYEKLISNLAGIQAILGYWGQAIHQDVLTLAPKRISGRIDISSGMNVWLELRWYPIMLMIYNSGIGAIAAGKYENLNSLLLAPAIDKLDQSKKTNLADAMIRSVSELPKAFKTLPGQERQHVPVSEYLFKRIQPQLDDLLFLGSDYEQYFDRFEIFLSLIYTQNAQYGTFLGRFAWKFKNLRQDNPLQRLIAEANDFGDKWQPLQAGLFGGSFEKFTNNANKITERLQQLPWW